MQPRSQSEMPFAKLAKRFARIETGEKPVYLPKAEAMAFAILELSQRIAPPKIA